MHGAVVRSALVIASIVLAACADRAGPVAGRDDSDPATTGGAPSTPAPEDTGASPSDPPEELDTAPPAPTEAPPDTTDPAPPETDTEDGRRPPELGGVDELFPSLGSPDVDIRSYDVRLDLTALGTREAGEVATLSGQVAVEASVPVEVDGLALDAVGLEVDGATVDGAPASVDVERTDIVIALPPERDDVVTATVDYSVDLARSPSPSGLPVGWFVEGDRAHVLNQPDGARTWLPSNDHPSDKAEWRFEIMAPEGWVVSANGDLVQEGDADEPWIWVEPDPMATYLIHLAVGDLEIVDDTVETAGGPLDLTHVFPAGEEERYTAAVGSISPQLDYLETVLGPYPLGNYGLAFAGLVDGLAMETQGRSLLDENAHAGALGAFDELVLAHELVHQWFGNSVTPATWRDIWLSESFATYGQWLWFDAAGLQTIDSSAQTALANRRFRGGPPTGSPGVGDLFGYNVYDGGAAVLHALRLTMGNEPFFELLQRWAADHRGTSQSSGDFVELAAEIHGGDLTVFFDEWLYAGTLPSRYPS